MRSAAAADGDAVAPVRLAADDAEPDGGVDGVDGVLTAALRTWC